MLVVVIIVELILSLFQTFVCMIMIDDIVHHAAVYTIAVGVCSGDLIMIPDLDLALD